MKDWMILAADSIMLASCFTMFCYMVWWIINNQDKMDNLRIQHQKDTRWKNKEAITTFIFTYTTIMSTLLIGIWGYKQ